MSLLAAPNTDHPEPKLIAPRQRGLTLTAPDGDNRRYLFKGLIGVGTAPSMFRLIFGAILDNSRSERVGEYFSYVEMKKTLMNLSKLIAETERKVLFIIARFNAVYL